MFIDELLGCLCFEEWVLEMVFFWVLLVFRRYWVVELDGCFCVDGVWILDVVFIVLLLYKMFWVEEFEGWFEIRLWMFIFEGWVIMVIDLVFRFNVEFEGVVGYKMFCKDELLMWGVLVFKLWLCKL